MASLLIVDDQDIVRQGIRKMLEEFDLGIAPILEASDGVDALIQANRHRPDIILADIMMPEMDGLMFIDELRSAGSGARIVIISAHSEFEYARKAIALKVDNYILKPVTRKELYKTLTSLLDTMPRAAGATGTQAGLRFGDSLPRGTFSRVEGIGPGPDGGDPAAGVRKAFRQGSREELAKAIDELFFRLGTSGATPQEAREALQTLVQTLQADLAERNGEPPLSEAYLAKLGDSDDFLGLRAAVKNEIERMHDAPRQPQPAEVVSPVIREVLKYVRRNYSTETSLAYIANDQNMNYNYLSSLFTKIMGISFSDYLMKFRLEKAMELLRDGRHKVQEVSELVGFNDSKYFCRAFKKHFGMTPSEILPGKRRSE